MRWVIHLAALTGVGAVAVAFGRWLRDPASGGDLIALLVAVAISGGGRRAGRPSVRRRCGPKRERPTLGAG
jgi:hypothetical protein